MALSKLMEREVVVVPILICRSMLSPEPDSHDARLRVGMAAQWEHIQLYIQLTMLCAYVCNLVGLEQ